MKKNAITKAVKATKAKHAKAEAQEKYADSLLVVSKNDSANVLAVQPDSVAEDASNELQLPTPEQLGISISTGFSGDTLKGIIYTEHPDTHVKLQGYTIPFVKEAVQMVLKAATITPQIRYVGWDVATTPNGPAIIEGNTYCAHDFWQLPPHTPDGIGMLPKIKKYVPEFFEGKIK